MNYVGVTVLREHIIRGKVIVKLDNTFTMNPPPGDDVTGSEVTQSTSVYAFVITVSI